MGSETLHKTVVNTFHLQMNAFCFYLCFTQSLFFSFVIHICWNDLRETFAMTLTIKSIVWDISVQSPGSCFQIKSIIGKKYILLSRVAVLNFVQQCSRHISAKQRWAFWKPFLIQFCCFREAFKVSICTFLSSLSLWLNKLSVGYVWLLRTAGESTPSLFTFCCAPSLTAVSLRLLTQPQQPLFCQQKHSQERSTERCPFALLRGPKICGSIISSVRPVRVCDGLNWAGGR